MWEQLLTSVFKIRLNMIIIQLCCLKFSLRFPKKVKLQAGNQRKLCLLWGPMFGAVIKALELMCYFFHLQLPCCAPNHSEGKCLLKKEKVLFYLT